MAEEDDKRGVLNRPEQAIKERKRKQREDVEQLREETNELGGKITGNPAVVKAIRKLEERVENLEEEVMD